jgi:hypothetical protein
MKSLALHAAGHDYVFPIRTDQQERKMQAIKPFPVFQPVAGRNFPQFLFIVHAYSIAQARALVAARVVGETIVLRPGKYPWLKELMAHEAGGGPESGA